MTEKVSTRAALVAVFSLALIGGANPADADFTQPSEDCPGTLVRFEGTQNNQGDFIALVIPSGVTVTCTALPGTPLTNNGAGEIEIFAVDLPDIGVALGGNSGRIANSGLIQAEGPEAVAAGIEGDNAEIVNNGGLEATGTDSVAAGIEGDHGMITNNADKTATATGDEASGLFVEGNDAKITNAGSVTVNGDFASGVAADGDGATLTNDGTIDVTGNTAVALGAAGAGATLGNSGTIGTDGNNAFGIAVLGTGATITNEASGTVTTAGTGAHGIALGLENAGDLVGGLIPPVASAPAQGDIKNFGKITTAGAEADGIHSFANDGVIENHNEIVTSGDRAAAINQFGDRVAITNFYILSSTGEKAPGIRARGQALTIVNGAEAGHGAAASIATTGDGAHGIVVAPQSGSETDPSLFVASNADVTNVTSIETAGEKAHGILAAVDDSTIENKRSIKATGKDSRGISTLGAMVEIDNAGIIEAGTRDTMTDEGSVGIGFTGQSTVENSDKGNIFVFGENSAGVRGRDGGDSTLGNSGSISVLGKNARGIDVEGDTVDVENGRSFQNGQPFAKALIAVEGENAIGIRTSGEGAFVSNRATRTEDGMDTVGMSIFGRNAVGIDATATGSGAFLVENAGKMQVVGAGAVGMALRNNADGARAFSAADGVSDCVGVAKGAGLLNCGNLVVTDTDGTGAVGLLAQGLNDSTIDNFGTIDVTGDNAVAIKLEDGANGAGADNNFVLNLTDAVAKGDKAIGASIKGDGNVLVQGNSEIILPVDETTFTAISQFVDIATAAVTNGTGSGEQIFPLGDLKASGPDAIGVSVEGNNNVVGISMGLSDFDPTGSMPGLPTAPKIASVIATETDSIGIALSGDNNTVANFGIVSGKDKAIQGGAGKETVIAAGIFVGGIDLAGGDDEFNLGVGMDEEIFVDNETKSIAGTVDGGAGIDTFRLIDSSFFGGGIKSSGVEDFPEEFFRFGTVDGDRVRNFEKFIVDITDANVDLKNHFVTDTATIENGTLRLDSARLEAERITIRGSGFLTGNGTITALPNDIGKINLSEIDVETGARVMPGNSPGTLEFIGDTVFAGILEIEIAGLTDGLFDRLIVDGDLTFTGGVIEFVFLDDFLPGEGEVFDFLSVTGDVLGAHLVSFSFNGLPTGFDFDISMMPRAGGGTGFLLETLAVPDAAAVPEPATFILFGFGLERVAFN